MLKDSQETHSFQAKIISPKLDQKIHSPKLPNLANTQKLSQKYFVSSFSVEPLPKISIKKNILTNASSPKEQNRAPLKFVRENPLAFLKLSTSEEPLQDGSPLAVQEPKNCTEIEDSKTQLSSKIENPSQNQSMPVIMPGESKENLKSLSEELKKLKIELSRANETIKSKEQIEKHLEQSQKEKINSLLSENSSLRTYTQELSKKINKTKASKQKIFQEIETLKSSTQNMQSKSEETINLLKEELKEKQIEIELLRDVISRNELQKLKLQDSLKDAEKQITELSHEYKITDFHHQALKEKFKHLSQEFEKTETRASQFEDTTQKLEVQKNIVKCLETKQLENTEEIKKLNLKVDSLKYVIEVQRQQFHKKETGYQGTIQELLNKMENERISAEVRFNETAKLKRALTVRDFDEDFTSFNREEVQRYLNRMRQAEEDSANRLVVIERLSKTIDYYKELILSKNEMIEMIEKEKENPDENGEKTIFQLIKDFKQMVLCNKCKKNPSNCFVRPCYHIFCSVCVPENSVCAVCYKKYNYLSPNSYFEAVFSLISHLDKLVN